MWHDRTQIAALTLLFALTAPLGAQDAKPAAPAPEAKQAAAPAKAPKAAKPGKPKAPPADNAEVKPAIAAQSKARAKALKAERAKPAPIKPRVDINSASKEELKKLPGITDAYADKIIAGRPYPTKAYLITRGIIPYAVYTPLKNRLLAGSKP